MPGKDLECNVGRCSPLGTGGIGRWRAGARPGVPGQLPASGDSSFIHQASGTHSSAAVIVV